MKPFIIFCCLMAAQLTRAQAVPAENPTLAALVRADNAFGFKLLAATRKSQPSANLFQSPVGLAFALSLVGSGAGGETWNQMARACQIGEMPQPALNEANKVLLDSLLGLEPGVKMEIANGIWMDTRAKIKPEFIAGAQKSYRASAASADFANPATVKEINDWVSDSTHGKIPQMVEPPLERDLRLIVLDAIYFKAAWEVPFDKQLTHDLPFTLSGGQSVQRPRMSRSARWSYFENADFQAVALPYTGRRVSLYVFLPRESLDRFLPELTPENWDAWMRAFGFRQGKVELPRFKMENEFRLNDELKAMGMPLAFTRQADFSGISDWGLFISWVKQKTYVEVNEEGTEAAAVSGIGMRASAVQRPAAPFTMIVDKPFYAAIRDNQTGVILFHGIIEDPK